MASGGDPAPGVVWTISSQTEAAAVPAGPPPGDFMQGLTEAGPIGWATFGILVVFSVVSWAIIVFKAIQLLRATRRSEAFLSAFWDAKRLDQMYKDSEAFGISPVCQVFRAGYVELARLKKRASEDDLGGGIENVERALRRSQASEVTALERHTTFLATVGSTSPFIGLFGTVWGIMKSFREIGLAGSANLATVAPGISEALVATAAGLAAAIPAVIAYNYIGARVRVLESEMDAFSSDFLNIVKRHYFR
ncbi:MAG TPA: protein TolQ [Myxococcales bacterium LLY-WYZ-16_1]|jgi:biopolymer transport protein TolQ|nr:protein TolQ [Myxococcales bacterium LLY-WYZ-16_1]